MANKNKLAADVASLVDQLAAKRSELVESKRSHAARELVNPRALTRIRKEIARIKTQINVPVTEIKSAVKEAVTKEEEKK